MAEKTGILLMNLGSPNSTSVKDVRSYLNEFLMDERVIDKPWLTRLMLVKGIIVPFRAPKSAHAYRKIWTDEGSPLLVTTRLQQAALEKEIEEPVEIAMRYGHPTPKEAFERLMKRVPGLTEVIALPLYPHYAMSSYETAVEHARKEYEKGAYPFAIRFVEPFYDNEAYLQALSESIRPYLEEPYDHILFSYHGIPERHIRKSDPTGSHCLTVSDCCTQDSPAHSSCYRHQCFSTTWQVAKRLGLSPDRYSISFQSRLGRDPWLIPFTAERFVSMPKEQIRRLVVVCPAFVSDCLETLEEIAMAGRESFLESGGESFTLVPCLNVHPMWIQAIKGLVKTIASGTERPVAVT